MNTKLNVNKKKNSELKSRLEHRLNGTDTGSTAQAVVTSASEAESAPQPSQAGQSTALDLAQRKQNRLLPQQEVLATLRQSMPRAFELSEVVGAWVWVTFPEKQPATVTAQLSQLGFHWNSRRQVWQHPCGVLETPRPDPRAKYQAYHPADQVAA